MSHLLCRATIAYFLPLAQKSLKRGNRMQPSRQKQNPRSGLTCGLELCICVMVGLRFCDGRQGGAYYKNQVFRMRVICDSGHSYNYNKAEREMLTIRKWCQTEKCMEDLDLLSSFFSFVLFSSTRRSCGCILAFPCITAF